MGSPDAVVVGAGIIGAACAYELASSGRDVLVVERGSAWAGECTAASAGLICPSHAKPLASLDSIRAALRFAGRAGSPLRIVPQRHLSSWLARFVAAARPKQAHRSEELLHRLAVESLARLYDLADTGVAKGVVRMGILYVHQSERAFARAVRHARSVDAAREFEIVSANDIRRFVRVGARNCAGGLYYPSEAHCEPVMLTESLGRAAEDLGARSSFGEEAIAIRANASTTEVVLRSKVVRTSSVIVCAGAASKDLIAPLGTRLPLLSGRGYAIDLLASPPAEMPVFMQDERVVMTPFPGGTRLSGTLELVPDHRRVDPRRIASIRKSGDLIGVSQGAAVASVRAGLRPCLPDGLPAVGAVRRAPTVIVATGHAMLGLTLALATAQIVRSALDNGRPSADAHALAPARFEGRRTCQAL
jgi:D-amino-acid dehydrogenase